MTRTAVALCLMVACTAPPPTPEAPASPTSVPGEPESVDVTETGGVAAEARCKPLFAPTEVIDQSKLNLHIFKAVP